MNPVSSLILGAIQGFTEFLPISSSGHLVLAQSLIPGFSQPGVLFDVILHGGTLLAVVIYFREKLLHLTQKQILLLAIGTVPAGLIGALFSSALENSFNDVRSIGFQFLISALFCFVVDRAKTKTDQITNKNAFTIGISQAVAIIPAISRSGATIFTGTLLGVNRKQAAEFSFLLSIPAIGGAIALEVLKYKGQFVLDPINYSVGFAASFIFGFLSIGVLLKLLIEKNFKIFGYYCLVLGLALIFIHF